MRLLLATALLTGRSRPRRRSQAPDAEIFLVSLSSTGGKLAVTGARNLTNRPGYDNQPNWSRDGAHAVFHLGARRRAGRHLPRRPLRASGRRCA